LRQAVVNQPPPISEAELRERIAMGEEAFNAGRIKDARAIYLEALKLAPGNAELIRRRDLTDRRNRYEDQVRAGEDLERMGKLEDALRHYDEAKVMVDDDTPQGLAVQARIDRTRAAIERAKLPVAEFVPVVPRDEQAEELARVEAQASNLVREKDYVKAEVAFTRAAELAGAARKAVFVERARQCRRMNFVAQARSAEAAGELARAEKAYVQAQDLFNDAETAAALEAVRQKINLEERTEARYQEAMRDGQAAIDKGDFPQARVKFGVAMGLKPDASPPASKLNEVEGRELLLKGDGAREAGDLVEARSLYERAVTKSAPLEGEAQARIKALEKVPSRADRAVAKACELAVAGKEEDAAATLEAAWKLDANSVVLKEAKEALDAARASSDAYEQSQKLMTEGLEYLKRATAIEDDEGTKRFRATWTKLHTEGTEKAKKSMALFGAHDFTATKAALTAAQDAAGELNVELTKAYEHYAKLAEKAEDKTGIKVPFLPKIGVGGDRKKADKYHGIVTGLKQLAVQAKALQKP
jgi:hypothetical protein